MIALRPVWLVYGSLSSLWHRVGSGAPGCAASASPHAFQLLESLAFRRLGLLHRFEVTI